MDVIKLKN